MTFLKEKWPILLMSLLEMVIGIVLLIHPVNSTNIAIIITGILLLVRGILCAVKYLRAEPAAAAKEQNLAKALILVAAGMFCMLGSQKLLNTLPSLPTLYGVIILVMGFFKVQRTVDMLRAKHEQTIWAAASALLALAVGLVILWNPFSKPAALWVFTGICLLAEAIVDILSLFLRGKKPEKPGKPAETRKPAETTTPEKTENDPPAEPA